MIRFNSHSRSQTPEKDSHVVPRKRGILVVDDMELILELLKFALEPCGFAVWLAVDGDDAVDLFRQNRAEIDLVLLDVHMKGLDGPQTLAMLQRLDPDVLACFMTGSFSVYTEEDLLQRAAAYVFEKPFHTPDVARYLQRIVESTDAATPAAGASRSRRKPAR